MYNVTVVSSCHTMVYLFLNCFVPMTKAIDSRVFGPDYADQVGESFLAFIFGILDDLCE